MPCLIGFCGRFHGTSAQTGQPPAFALIGMEMIVSSERRDAPTASSVAQPDTDVSEVR